jgi:polysaccharide export outer membrane protein
MLGTVVVRVLVERWSRAAVIAIAMVAGCSDPPPSQYPTQTTYVEDSTVAATDVLDVRVTKQDQISGEYEVDANGQFSFPYIGVVEARGKTPTQIEGDIRDRLADGWLRSPQVVVRVKDARSKKISVFGEVRKGAIIPYTDGMTIMEAISSAGGFTNRAWENAVQVRRQAKEFTVPVKSIASGQAAPFFMRPGDAVYVPKSPL